MKSRIRAILAVFLIVGLALPTAFGGVTAFTYQGRLTDGGNAANGSYDFQFTLFAVNTGGSSVAGPVSNPGIVVSNGLFITTIDFGQAPFISASNWLNIAVRTNGGSTFTNLTPRQQLTPAPYAIASTLASNLVGTVSASQLTGSISNANLPSSPTFSGTVTATHVTSMAELIAGQILSQSFVVINNSDFATGSTEQLRIVRGTVNANAQIVNGSGFTVTSNSPGNLTINFSPAFSGTPTVMATSSVLGTFSGAGSATSTGVLVINYVIDFNDKTFDLANESFSFIAVGPP